MGLLDNVLSAIDAKKRSLKRGVMDMIDNPNQWAGMQANRIQEDRYGGAENAQAMKQYLTQQPYDKTALTAANDALRNAAINESLGAVTAWHGSPHKFDKFDMSKIGTGEGAQAYGHGLYTAESRGVGEEYMNTLSGPKNRILDRNYKKAAIFDDPLGDGSVWQVGQATGATAKGQLGYGMESNMTVDDSLVNAYKEARKSGFLSDVDNPAFAEVHPDGIRKIEDISNFKPNGNQVIAYDPGYLYKVDIPDEAVAKFLDWDKPLSQQAPEVQKALSSSKNKQLRAVIDYASSPYSTPGLEGEVKTMGEAIKLLGMNASPAKGSAMLAKQGIPGIRYLDGGSRGAGAGTSNYVLFDDKLPRILETNGKPTGLQPWAKGEWEGLLGK